jgi:hypothetical protein
MVSRIQSMVSRPYHLEPVVRLFMVGSTLLSKAVHLLVVMKHMGNWEGVGTGITIYP